MSKVAIFVAVPALLGAGALAVVSLQLGADLEAASDRIGDLERALAEVEERVDQPPARTGERRDEARLRELEARLASLEGRPTPAPLAAVDPETPSAAPMELTAGGTEIEQAVSRVLEEREAERRLERREQMVARGAERLLRDVEVTDEQRGRVEGLFADYVRRLSEMREQDLGQDLTAERSAELRGELKRGLESVLDATQMEAVGARMERRLGDDRRRGDRRGGRRGARRPGGDS